MLGFLPPISNDNFLNFLEAMLAILLPVSVPPVNDITGVDLTGGTGITIGSETNTTSGSYSSTITNSGVTSIVAGSNISISGETGAVTVTGTDTNTTYTGGTNLTLSGTTFNVDDAFLKNNANDTTSGTITAGGFTTTGSITLSGGAHSFNDIDIGSEFTDADDHIMSSGAIKEKIEDYGYTTNTGDITGVTAGTGMSGGGSSGSVTLTNAGVTSIVAGSGISISGATGAVTVTASGGGGGAGGLEISQPPPVNVPSCVHTRLSELASPLKAWPIGV